MPALVKRRFGLSGMRLEEGTMVCCFDLKKSRNDWRISLLVIIVPLGAVRVGRCRRSPLTLPSPLRGERERASWLKGKRDEPACGSGENSRRNDQMPNVKGNTKCPNAKYQGRE